MNADKYIENAKYLGLLNEDNRPNYENCHITQEAGYGWKQLTKPHKDPVHGWCTASMWIRDDGLMQNPVLEKAQEK